LDEIKAAGNKVNIIILDACRDNPFKGFRSSAGGLATMNGPKGSYVAFSTSPGSVARDGKDKNGTYTKYLIHYIQQPGLKIEEMFKHVRKSVSEETNNAQIPWENSSLMGDFCFSGCDGAAITGLNEQPVQVASLEKQPLKSAPSGTSENSAVPNIEMVKIPKMNFSIGKYEVTQGQWLALMGKNPSKFTACGNDCPVEMVSWDDAQLFIGKLNQLTGKNYRLPSETEWLLACQAGGGYFGGNKFCGSNESESVAWDSENSGARTHPVGQKKPNGWGIHDMSGNVWEWTQGCFEGNCSTRIYRGGAWGVNFAADISSAYRSWNIPENRLSSSIGFRVALDE